MVYLIMGKYCLTCDKDKKEKDFYKTNNVRCKECCIEASLEYRFKKFGLTKEQYLVLRDKQNSCCLICGRKEKERTKKFERCLLSVDHDHVTGKVRGLLCHRCNGGLGLLGDSVENLKKAIQYLSENV